MKKPLDIGNGLVCASLDRAGAWLSLGTYHSRYGFVELTALPPFDERRRGDPAAVRRYRALMVDSQFAFLALKAEGWRRTVSVAAVAGQPAIEQRQTLTAEVPNPLPPILSFRGTIDRPALAEITETNPPQPTGATTHLRAVAQTLQIDAPELPARAEIHVAAIESGWELIGGDARLVLKPDAAGVSELTVLIRCSLSGRETS
jgi:hypothetical protein